MPPGAPVDHAQRIDHRGTRRSPSNRWCDSISSTDVVALRVRRWRQKPPRYRRSSTTLSPSRDELARVRCRCRTGTRYSPPPPRWTWQIASRRSRCRSNSPGVRRVPAMLAARVAAALRVAPLSLAADRRSPADARLQQAACCLLPVRRRRASRPCPLGPMRDVPETLKLPRPRSTLLAAPGSGGSGAVAGHRAPPRAFRRWGRARYTGLARRPLALDRGGEAHSQV